MVSLLTIKIENAYFILKFHRKVSNSKFYLFRFIQVANYCNILLYFFVKVMLAHYQTQSSDLPNRQLISFIGGLFTTILSID